MKWLKNDTAAAQCKNKNCMMVMRKRCRADDLAGQLVKSYLPGTHHCPAELQNYLRSCKRKGETGFPGCPRFSSSTSNKAFCIGNPALSASPDLTDDLA